MSPRVSGPLPRADSKYPRFRLKRDVQTDLPSKTTLVVWCPLSDMQRFWYKRLLINSGEAKQLVGGTDESGNDARYVLRPRCAACADMRVACFRVWPTEVSGREIHHLMCFVS